MNVLTAIYQALPPYVWAFFLGTPFIVWFIQLMKKLTGVHSTLVIHVLTATTSFLVVALPLYILNDPKPWQFLGSYAGGFFTAANILYAICKALVPFWASVKAYEDKKEAQKSGTTDTHVTQIPVQTSEFDG